MKPNKKAKKSQLRPELIRENSDAQKIPKEKTIAFYLIAMRMGGSAEGEAGFISVREVCHCVAPRRKGKKRQKERKRKKKERKRKKEKNTSTHTHTPIPPPRSSLTAEDTASLLPVSIFFFIINRQCPVGSD